MQGNGTKRQRENMNAVRQVFISTKNIVKYIEVSSPVWALAAIVDQLSCFRKDLTEITSVWQVERLQ